MHSLTNADWAALRRIIVLYIVACVWSYGIYKTSYSFESFRAAGLAFITSGVCLFLYWGGKNPCILWRHEFGDSLGVTLFEKIVAPIAPIWFVKFSTLFVRGAINPLAVNPFDLADAIFALFLFLVMLDFGGYQSAFFQKAVENRIELSFREVGLGYPPASKLATFIVFSLLYIFVVGLILIF